MSPTRGSLFHGIAIGDRAPAEPAPVGLAGWDRIDGQIALSEYARRRGWPAYPCSHGQIAGSQAGCRYHRVRWASAARTWGDLGEPRPPHGATRTPAPAGVRWEGKGPPVL